MENPIRLPSITLFQKTDGVVGIDILWDESNIDECAKLVMELLQGKYNSVIASNAIKNKELSRLMIEMLAQDKLRQNLNSPNEEHRDDPLVDPRALWDKLSGGSDDDPEQHDHDHDCFDDSDL